MELLNNCFLILSIIIIGATIFLWGQKYKDKDNTLHSSEGVIKSYTRNELIIFGAIMLVALVARLWQFGEIPGGMNQDGAMAAVDAKALADHGTDRYGMHMPVHFTAWGYGQMSVLLSYCMVPFIKLFGLSAVTARLPILIASMAGLAALYFIARRLFGIRAAQITLILAAFNPWHFLQSRWALDCNMFPHMFILGLMFLLMGLESKRRYVYISMIFFALCMYSYGISFYTVPVFLLAVCIYILVKKALKWTEVLISAGIYLLVSWPIYLTMAINTFKWETIETPFFTIPFFPDSVRSQDILFFAEDKLGQLQLNLNALKRIFTEGDHLLWNSIDGFGAINICFVPFIFLGLYYVIHLFRKEKDSLRKIGYFSLLCFFGIGILAGVITSEVNVNRINIILYTFIIYAAIGIYFVYRNHKLISYAVAPVYLVLTVMLLGRYFTSFADEISTIFFSDFIEAVQYIGDDEDCAYYVITPDSQFEGAWNVSEILTLYALDIDAEYFQGKTKDDNGLMYSDKFYYSNPDQTGVDPSIPAAYVCTADDIGMFSAEDYDIQQFGNYYAAIPLME